MRTVLFAVFVVLVAAPVAARQTSRLDDPVRTEFRVDAPGADTCAGYTAVDQIARQAHVLVGFEQPSDCWVRGRKRTADATGVTLTGMSARQALDRLMALMPEYSWREMDGVAVVRPAAKWEDPADVLNFPASAFSLTGDANDALHEALQAVTPPVFFPHVDDQQSIEGPVPFVFPGGTLLDALNAIVRAHRGAGWQLGYQGNRGTIRLDTLVFDSGAVMAPILLPRSPVVPLLLTGAGIQGPSPRGVSPATAGPSVIYWPGAGPGDRNNPTEVGLLYTPEVLAALASRSPEAVSPRVQEAIREQTPIVVLWTIPPQGGEPPWPRPFSAVIVERGIYSSVPRVEPLWTEQHADDIRQLDPGRSFSQVGVMAAFPRSAFVPGHIVIIYRALPTTEPGMSKGVERFGLIDWNGGPNPQMPASDK